MKKIFLLGLLLIGCTKPKDCQVTEVMTVKEVRIDSTYLKREYIVILECY